MRRQNSTAPVRRAGRLLAATVFLAIITGVTATAGIAWGDTAVPVQSPAPSVRGAEALSAPAPQDESKPSRPRKSRAPDLEKRLEEVAERLSLTDDQREPVFTILREEDSSRKVIFAAAREKGRDGMKELRDKMQSLQAETEKKLAAHLTGEQMAEYRKMIEERRAERESRRGKGRGGRGGGSKPF